MSRQSRFPQHAAKPRRVGILYKVTDDASCVRRHLSIGAVPHVAEFLEIVRREHCPLSRVRSCRRCQLRDPRDLDPRDLHSMFLEIFSLHVVFRNQNPRATSRASGPTQKCIVQTVGGGRGWGRWIFLGAQTKEFSGSPSHFFDTSV